MAAIQTAPAPPQISVRPLTHIPALDGYRGLALLIVLYLHSVYMPKLTVYFGFLAIDTFFVLSGFLITRILLHSHSRGYPIRRFYLRRLFRIFPAYYLLLFAVALWVWMPDWIWCSVYLSNFYYSFKPGPTPLGHTWSLSVEEHFYLLWPLAVYYLPRATSYRIALYALPAFSFATALGVIVAARYFHVLDLDIVDRFVYRGSFFRFSSLGLGAALAYNEGWILAHRKQLKRWCLPIAIFGLICLLFPPARLTVRPIFNLFFFSLVSVSLLLVVLCLDRGSAASRLLEWRPVTFLGDISYGAYLFHYPIYYFFTIWTAPLPVWILCVILTFALAILSHFFFEGPIRRLAPK
jgi:peptidoglycan/LPS O-acetylase OafA/YrhL